MTKDKTDKVELNAQKREVFGGRVNGLRRQGLIPGVLYGKGMESISLQMLEKDFNKALKTAGESTLVYINVDGKTYPTIIHDVARDPLKDNVIHADFYKVRLDEKIKAMIPVVFEGEAPAVKELGGIFVRNINELEVEALPQDLPHEIKIDISGLKQFGDQIQVKDIKLNLNVSLIAQPDEILGLVQEPISEEQLQKELEVPTEGVEGVEEIKKEKLEGEEGKESEEGKEAPVPAKGESKPATPAPEEKK